MLVYTQKDGTQDRALRDPSFHILWALILSQFLHRCSKEQRELVILLLNSSTSTFVRHYLHDLEY
jgi:hypothetical protein